MLRATETVVSMLPPSATIVSYGFRPDIARRLSSKIKASLRVGITIDTFNVSSSKRKDYCLELDRKMQNMRLGSLFNGLS